MLRSVGAPERRPAVLKALGLWAVLAGSISLAPAVTAAGGRCGTAALPPDRTPALVQKRAVAPEGPIQEGSSTTFVAYNFMARAYENVPATCRKLGAYCYVYVADDQWNGSVDQPQVDQLSEVFDTRTQAYPDQGLYEVVTTVFGSPPDVDGDPRITLLALDIQDGFGQGSSVYYAGYFDSVDQSAGNLRDMVYLDTHPSNLAGRESKATLAHEFQHLIHWRYDSDEDRWINEGCSGYAELVTGYADTWGAAFAEHPDNDLTDWHATDDPLRDWDEALIDYDQSFMFIAYLAEHYGGAGLLRQLVSQPHNGARGVDLALSSVGQAAQFADVFADWTVANFLDNGGPYGYQSLDVPPFAATVRPSLPVPDTSAQISPWAAHYVLFVSGEPLHVRFAQDPSGAYRVYGATLQSGHVAVTPLDLEDGIAQFSAAQVDSAVLIVARTSSTPGSYAYSAEPRTDAVASGHGADALLPVGWGLGPNFPNPFNASTLIPFWVPDGQQGDPVLEIFDAAGRKVTTLAPGLSRPGACCVVWRGKDASGRPAASGVYVVRLTAGSVRLCRRALLVR